nr:MAG: rep protein [Cressdnaviricota sp.]
MPTKHFKVSQVLLTYPQCTKDKKELLEYLKQRGDIMSAIVCHENHHQTDGEHLHAWIKLDRQKQVTANQWATMFDWEEIHGHYDRVTCTTRSIADTVKYVIKDGDYEAWNCDVEALTNPGKCHTRKYDNERILSTPMKQLVDEGIVNIKDVPSYQRGIQAYKLLDKPGTKTKCRGIWLTGPAGCGKSTWAHKLGEHLGGYYEKSQTKWWDGYDRERVVVLDDLDTEVLLHYLKIWSDKFPCKGEVKGATVWLHHEWFVVTSNFSILDITNKTGDSQHFYEALKRRFRELTLPPSAEYFQFDPDCDWSNPDEPEVEPPESKQQP